MIEDRELSKVKNLFKSDNKGIPILLSPTDIGVRKNGGKNGARFAPEVILKQFKNLTIQKIKSSFYTNFISEELEERKDFISAQKSEIKRAKESDLSKSVIHLGGGHDHVYPLLMAIQEVHKNILVVNIDAHCDTRIDSEPHSGNPFRLFDQNKDKSTTFEIIQFGAHAYSNSTATFQNLKNSEMLVIEDPNDIETLFKEIKSRSNGKKIVLSLDCDGLDSSVMRAVSCVNHNGTRSDEALKIIQFVKSIEAHPIFGIYEYNPIFDDTNVSAARLLASLIYELYLK